MSHFVHHREVTMNRPEYTNKKVESHINGFKLLTINPEDDYDPFNGINATLCELSRIINEHFYQTQDRKLSFCWEDNDEFNAYAESFTSTNECAIDFANIHSGVFLRALSLFQTLLKLDDTFMSVGEKARVGGDEAAAHTERMAFAYSLAVLATSFVFLHEAGHLAWGHTDYCETHNPGIRIRQNLEIQADLFAIDWLLNIGIARVFETKRNGATPDFGDELANSTHGLLWGDGDSMLRNTIYAIYAIERIWNDTEFTQSTDEHPSWYVRINLLIPGLIYRLDTPLLFPKEKTREDLIEYIFDACLIAEEDMRKLGFEESVIQYDDEMLKQYMVEGAKVKLENEAAMMKYWRNPSMVELHKTFFK